VPAPPSARTFPSSAPALAGGLAPMSAIQRAHEPCRARPGTLAVRCGTRHGGGVSASSCRAPCWLWLLAPACLGSGRLVRTPRAAPARARTSARGCRDSDRKRRDLWRVILISGRGFSSDRTGRRIWIVARSPDMCARESTRCSSMAFFTSRQAHVSD
jgi:hypothetical protein